MIIKTDENVALSLSTFAFTACFAVWTIFAIIGVQIKQDLGLTDTQFSLLIGTPILTGSLVRLFFGIWADQYGGRPIFMAVMLSSAFFTWCLTYADTYEMMLLTALGVGISGGSFVVGISYLSKWHDKAHQGTALGVYGMGNIGAAVTKFVAPFVMVAYGWHMVAQVWAIALVIMAILFWLFTKDEPQIQAQKASQSSPKSMLESLQPLKKLQVWRFSLYYFFVFGGFVALALWLPRYYVGVYGMDIKMAGMLAASFSVAGSLFRAAGGYLSDKYGARAVMYWTFFVCSACCFLLAYPQTDYVIHGIKGDIAFSFGWGFISFTIIVFVLGFFMSLGKAAIYKHIPVYYPNDVGSVAGIVGLIGGLGGFFLPLAFGIMNDWIGIWTSCFMLMFVLVTIAFLWMHISIRLMERRKFPDISKPAYFTEMEKGPVLKIWKPEEQEFWLTEGQRIARRNLWLSVPALFLAFALWMVWSVVVVNLPKIGFAFTTEQLFWLTALPGLSGATLRIFYAFMIPVFGGRRWTALSTASLLIPAFGIGMAVQDPTTPYSTFLVLALLCGLGGGNFASSMANIAFFFPKKEKGNALALNAGLGNLGVSAVQFLVPIVIVFNLFGGLGGDSQNAGETQLWVQNAAYIWIPFIAASAILSWFYMNDIADAKASLASQLAIFQRKHNWIMCVLYIGTFGSFIGFSAGFPLLAKSQFPDVNSLQLAFLGPLVGALARAGSGWISDKFGGGRVTLWVFAVMILGTIGVLYFLGIKDQPGAFYGFFAMFILLFAATGVGNASTFQMIPVIFWQDRKRASLDSDQGGLRLQSAFKNGI
jgi:NNP family nitrate/nitrite transporter-like MFS transporter